MKLSNVKHSIIVGAALCGTIYLSGCNPATGDGKIPVDEQKAAEHIITGAQGVAYIQSFKTAKAELAHAPMTDSFLNKEFQLPVAESFNRDAIAALLNADGAVGIRIYLGRDDSGQVRMVLLPVDKFGNDVHAKLVTVPIPPRPGGAKEHVEESQNPPSGYQVVDIGQRCPTECDSLN